MIKLLERLGKFIEVNTVLVVISILIVTLPLALLLINLVCGG